jgi:hypothetical protein
MQRAQQARRETELILKQQQADVERRKAEMEKKEQEREMVKVRFLVSSTNGGVPVWCECWLAARVRA